MRILPEAVEPIVEASSAEPVQNVQGRSTLLVEPELPAPGLEQVVGRGGSSVTKRKTPPPLVQVLEYKQQAREEARVRDEKIEEARDKRKSVEEQEREKQQQFQEFVSNQAIGGIVEGMDRRRRTANLQAEGATDRNYEEFQRYDDGRRYEHQVLDVRRAALRASDARELEARQTEAEILEERDRERDR